MEIHPFTPVNLEMKQGWQEDANVMIAIGIVTDMAIATVIVAVMMVQIVNLISLIEHLQVDYQEI